jgi:hypothetical protein
LSLVAAGDDRLAHLEGHQAAERRRLRFQAIRNPAHQTYPFIKSQEFPSREGVGRALQLDLNLRRCDGWNVASSSPVAGLRLSMVIR